MRIILIDDDQLVTLSLKTILESTGSVQVLATGASGAEAIALYQQWKPDVLLLDIQMPNGSGLDAGEQILQQDPNARILFLTTFSDDAYIAKALELGAKGYSNKEIAAALCFSEGTIRNYLSSILEKLQLRDRTQLAVYYYHHQMDV